MYCNRSLGMAPVPRGTRDAEFIRRPIAVSRIVFVRSPRRHFHTLLNALFVLAFHWHTVSTYGQWNFACVEHSRHVTVSTTIADASAGQDQIAISRFSSDDSASPVLSLLIPNVAKQCLCRTVPSRQFRTSVCRTGRLNGGSRG